MMGFPNSRQGKEWLLTVKPPATLQITGGFAWLAVVKVTDFEEEATAMFMGAVSAKTTTLIGFWHVRTMYEQGKMAQVIDEIKRYRLEIFGISEGRWTRSGRMKTGTIETILYSGREGVAIILKKGMENYLMEWKPVNSRIILARLKGRQINVSIIQCYPPANVSYNMKKEANEQLQATFEGPQCKDMLLADGRPECQVGSENVNH